MPPIWYVFLKCSTAIQFGVDGEAGEAKETKPGAGVLPWTTSKPWGPLRRSAREPQRKADSCRGEISVLKCLSLFQGRKKEENSADFSPRPVRTQRMERKDQLSKDPAVSFSLPGGGGGCGCCVERFFFTSCLRSLLDSLETNAVAMRSSPFTPCLVERLNNLSKPSTAIMTFDWGCWCVFFVGK